MRLTGLEGKVAVITGGGGNIGAAIVKRFAAEGTRIAAVDIRQATLNPLRDQLPGADLRTYDVDLASSEEVGAFAERSIADFGQVDFLINVAGGGIRPTRAMPDAQFRPGFRSIDSIDDDAWFRTLSINLSSAFFACRAFVPHMRFRHTGRIVNFSSFATRNGSTLAGPHYAAAKGGIVGLTKTLALELGPHNITANAIAPGRIPPGELPPDDPQIPLIPFRRPGKPEEIASVVAVLCSDAGSYVTGTTIDINGGLYIAP